MNLASASPSLLSLPYNVRKRIYVFAGLIRECPITIISSSRTVTYLDPRPVSSSVEECAYTLRKEGFPDCVSYGYEAECICPELPKQLLLVCKTLHEEAQHLLYGENKFIICARRQAEDLEVFKTLPIAGVNALRYLLIRLNSWPCIRGHNMSNRELGNCMICPAKITSSHIHSSDPELSINGDRTSEGIIKAFMEICQRLSNIAPGNLHLEFICDVKDLASAEYIVQPLKSLPRLRECSIRLGRKVDYALRSFAQSTALELTQEIYQAKAPANRPPVFPFFSLPREIRLHILRLTHLGPGGSFLDELDHISIKHGKFNHDAHHHDKYFAIRACCLNCSFTKLHCSCPVSFASYSSSCSCRVLPLELFLVNRQMYLDASETFYSTNIFQFSGPLSETQNMLMAIPTGSLSKIRQIRLDLNDASAFHQSSFVSQWRPFLSFINTHLNTSQLCIEIDLLDDYGQVMDSIDIDKALWNVYTGYITLVRGIREEISTLLDFHINLGVLYDLEPVLERYIMGADYDSLSGNRYPKRVNSSELFGEDDARFHEIPPWHTEL